MMSYSEMYTVSQVASMLKVSPVTVRSWIKKGWVEDRWDGKQYWITKDEFLFLKRRKS